MDLQPKTKAEWRAWAFGQRRALGLDQRGASEAVLEAVRELLQRSRARHVLAYWPMPGEPDVSALAQEWTLYITRTRYQPQRHLTIHPWHTATERSRFGYLQPPADAPQVPLSQMDAVLLPGVAFDQRGVRLGYGGGFYDRLLPGYAGQTVGIVWSPLFLAELPREPHDCLVQWIVTERGAFRAD